MKLPFLRHYKWGQTYMADRNPMWLHPQNMRATATKKKNTRAMRTSRRKMQRASRRRNR